MGIRYRMRNGLYVPHSQGGDFTSPRVPGPALTGLDFAGNTSFPSVTPNTPVLVWNNTIFGAAAPLAPYPATFIWRAYPRVNNDAYGSFWTMLFYAHYDTSFDIDTNTYYGFHPYPYPDPPDAGLNLWEISAGSGDHYDYPDGAVTFNQWHTCVARAWKEGTDEHWDFYWNWPNTSTDVITGYWPERGLPADPALIVGDAPWNKGKEAPNAILRGYQFYDSLLSLTDVADELANPGSVQTPWYLNLNPTPDDVTDKSGNGNHPAWIDANRPALWEG